MASKEFTPSPQQAAIYAKVEDRTAGNLIVEAVAGAGKTTTLVGACDRMQGSVFLGAYNTKMAKELRERTSHLQNVKAGTFHSAGMNALRRAITIKGDPDPKKVAKLADAYIQNKGRMDLDCIKSTAVAAVGMAKQRGIGPIFADRDEVWLDMIEHFGLDEDLPEDIEGRDWEKLLLQSIKFARVLLRMSNEQAKEEGVIDFDDMIFLPLVWNLRMWGNDWVLIDEAQDTNPTRRALAKKMLRPGGRLIAVGDPRQAIYGFSGADNDALAQIRQQFNAETLPLTVTYRCPKNVVAVAQEFVSHIEAHETAPDGEFGTIEFKDLIDALQPGDAVLCRYNKYLVNFCFRLIRMGKPARIEGRAIGAGLIALCSKWKSKTTEALATRVTSWMQREVKKAEAKGNDSKADQIRDRAETLLVLIERGMEQGIRDVAALKTMIEGLFDDRVVDSKTMITLCSVHRSKGLEFPRVFILGLYELMGRECRHAWQTEQEVNLQYVAATRAQSLLVDVTGVKEEKRQHSFDTEEEDA